MWVAEECREPLARLGFKEVTDFFRPRSGVGAERLQSRVLRVVDEGAGTFYVKSYARGLGTYFLRRSKAAGEAANLKLLPRLGVKTSELVAVGELRKWGKLKGAFIVTRELTPHVPLHNWIKRHWRGLSEEEKDALLRKLADVFATIHSQGYYDVDTGLKNFLYDAEKSGEICKIDSPKGKRLRDARFKPARAVADLARSWRDLRCCATYLDADRFLDLYAARMETDAGRLRAGVERRARKICFRSARMKLLRVRKYAAKASAWVHPALRRAGLTPEILGDPDFLGEVPVTSHGSRRTFFGNYKGRSWFLKRIRRPYVKDAARWFLFWGLLVDKALAELGALELFAGLGIAVPTAFGYSSDKAAGTWLAVQKLAGATALDVLLGGEGISSPRERRRVVRSAAETVREMHRVGLSQPDLFLKHLLVTKEDDSFKTFVIDLQRSWGSTGRSRTREIRELARLLVSSLKAKGVSNTDRLFFLMCYARSDTLDGATRRLARDVLAAAGKVKR